jgi:hypothetical protein
VLENKKNNKEKEGYEKEIGKNQLWIGLKGLWSDLISHPIGRG